MAKKGKKDKSAKSEFGQYKDKESRRRAMEELRQKAIVRAQNNKFHSIFFYRRSRI